MQHLTYDVLLVLALGLLLLLAVGVQYHFGKVYTRAGRGMKWHKKTVVSRQEAPYHFWIIIGVQFLIGLGLAVISGAEIYRRLV